jgi:hypothetical protein
MQRVELLEGGSDQLENMRIMIAGIIHYHHCHTRRTSHRFIL